MTKRTPGGPAGVPEESLNPPNASQADERLAWQRRLLAAREAADKRGALEAAPTLEESVGDDAPLPHPDDVLHRIDTLAQRMPADEIDNPQAFRAALETLLRFGRPALQKLAGITPGSAGTITPDDRGALEAVVIADGSRPSFLLRGGKPPTNHPFLGVWANDVIAFRDDVKKVAAAVGRVQPNGGHASRFVGTACLVDREKGLALTNYHVLNDAELRFGVAMTRTDRKVNISGDLEVDFAGEVDTLEMNRFKVVEAELPEQFGRGFGHRDAAMLRLEPLNATSVLPDRVISFSTDPAYVTGDADRLPSFCTIGFPGPAPKREGKTGEVDWDFVVTQLFGNKFGFKRLAPGRFHRALGSDPADTLQIVFGHDATTFGGASGSLLFAWKDAGPPAFGLHFAGRTEVANHAISVAAAADTLRRIGVPIQ